MTPRIVNVGLIGLGTIGTGVVKLLARNADRILARTGLDLRLARVAERDPARLDAVDLDPAVLTPDALAVIEDPSIDVIVELIGGMEPARELVRQALRAGKHVVTANKEIVSGAWSELHAEASRHGVSFHFSASAGGAMPIVPLIRDRLVGDRIEALLGILNGTSNYVLTAMSEKGETLPDALAEAQRLGYAEADPTQDINGKDAVRKLAILAQLAFGVSVDPGDIYTEGIESINRADLKAAESFGYVVKLLAIAKTAGDGVELRVHPCLVPREHPLASVRHEENAVYLRNDAADEMMLLGKGAGQMPTATAVVADVVEVASRRDGTPDRGVGLNHFRVKDVGEVVTRAYLRFTVEDRSGTIGRIATVLGAHDISLASVHASLFRDRPGWGHVELLTEPAVEERLQAAFHAAEAIEGVGAPSSLIRIEGEPAQFIDRIDSHFEREADALSASR